MPDENLLDTGTTQTDTGAQQTGTEGGDKPAEGQQQQGQAQAEGGTTPTEGEGQGSDKPEGDKPQGAPEKYEFTAPDGLKLDDGVMTEFAEVAKELNLPQDQAQKVIDKLAPKIAERQQAQFQETLQGLRTQWAEQSRADKEFGGDNLAENLGTAKKALDTFASPEFRQLLNESGMGNHPEVIRTFMRVGKAISEDKLVTGTKAAKANDARAMYPNSQMK